MTKHLLDDLVSTIGVFDVNDPRAHARAGMCLQFHDPLFGPRIDRISAVITRICALGDVMLGLAFWGPRSTRFLDPDDTFELLASRGVGHRTGWLCRDIDPTEADAPACEFYSQQITLTDENARLLSEIIVRMDFGTWQRVAAMFFLWVRGVALFRFWDDRGADVIGADESVVRVLRAKFQGEVDEELTRYVWPK